MKPLIYYSFMILMSVVFFSCDRNKQQETVCSSANTVLVPQDLKDRFFFKEGTYWIYQNLKTQETDSIWVFSSRIGTDPVNEDVHGSGYNKCYESFDVKTKSLKFYDPYYYSSLGIIYYPIKEIDLNKEVFKIEDQSSINQYYPFQRIRMKGNQYENIEGFKILKLDSMKTQTKMLFKDILRLKYSVGFQTRDYMDDMHYAKNIGLVKFYRFTDSSNWELIRYNIIQ